MAFQVQGTASKEEPIVYECGTNENGILFQTPPIDIVLNENCKDKDQVNYSYKDLYKPNIDNLRSNTFITIVEQSTCGGKKDIKNGDNFETLESNGVDNQVEIKHTVPLSPRKDPFADMKLPSVSVNESKDCTINSDLKLASKTIPNQPVDFLTQESNDVGHQCKISRVDQLSATKDSFKITESAPVSVNDKDGSIYFQTLQSSKVVDLENVNHTIQLNETKNLFVNKEHISMPAEEIQVYGQGKIYHASQLDKIKNAFPNAMITLSVKENHGHNINSDLNLDSEIIPDQQVDFPPFRSPQVDDMSGKSRSIQGAKLSAASKKEKQEHKGDSDLKQDSNMIPSEVIGYIPCIYQDPNHADLSLSKIENEESPLETRNNSIVILTVIDYQKMSDDPSIRSGNVSSENTSPNSSCTDQTTESSSETTTSTNSIFNVDNETSEHSCLLHPAYVQALALINEKDSKVVELDGSIKELQKVLSDENSKSERISELEQLLSQHEKELSLIKREQEIDKQSFTLVKKELENKCAILKKDIEMANRDKENMVMRYAVSEKELIDVKKEKEILMKKLKDTVKENESLLERIKNFVNDKSKLSQSLDAKTTDLSTAHKEIDKLKEEINARDIKIKWTQNKLKTEMETHKEYPAQIDRLMIRVRCLEEDLSNAKTESQNLKKQLEESEQNKVLESQLKEEQAKLIMQRYEHSEIETKYKSLQTKYQSMIEENNSLSFQVQNLETERLELEKKLSSSREDTEKLSNIVSDLQSKLVELDSLNSQLKQSEDKIDTLMSEIERVRHQNEELLQDMSACRARESEMLSFTQKLTTKNVQLQSEFSTLESKAATLEKKDEKSRVDIKELKEKLNEVQNELTKEKAKREEETHLLARQIAEKTKKSEAFEVDLADTKANLTQSKLKHTTVVKELQRELSLLRRKLESFEASGHGSSNSVSESPYAQACDVSKEILVERILKLQSEAAKSAEKIEFLEDHAAQLLAEVQKQSRLLQSYMLREEAGALAPSFLDNHKAEVSRHGGIMASLYSSTPQDEGMSLELSLEINRKLQAVLEDTLLKNIMLKENLDTLGDEIVMLKEKK